ncbi:MAG: baseplate J/gp47 family protein [Candidatus Binataceae bacterium]
MHFLNAVLMYGHVMAVTITGGESVPIVAVSPINDATDWSLDTNTPQRSLLKLTVPAPGDFSFYTLTLTSPLLDEYFDHVTFSFKAKCPSDLDCELPALECPPLARDAPPIDYLAKDFLSFRKALSDFSALRYPEWQERAEADFGVMFMEALSGLADDLSYTQDRIAGEATLDTATQRRSIVRHARLVDYEPRPAVASSVILQFDVDKDNTGEIPRGVLVNAQLPEAAPIYFETGTLVDPVTGLPSKVNYPANPKWNSDPGIQPYWWDDSQQCLMAGATEMWVLNQSLGFFLGQQLLIDTNFQDPTKPPVRELVTIAGFDEQSDPLIGSPPPTPVTHTVFSAPLQFDHDLTQTTLAGNLVPATQGRSMTAEVFAINTPPPANPQAPLAIVRTGANGTLQYLYTLQNAPLTWLPQSDPAAPPLPECLLNPEAPGWKWRRNLIDAEPYETSFTIEPATFSPTARDFNSKPVQDYDGDAGSTIRFGDGVFGGAPNSGDLFSASYRVGAGAVGNVAAGSITKVEPGSSAGITAVTNPFAASGGLDEETNQRIQRLAPQAFRAVQYRAVRPEDYVAAAWTLPWVLRAGSVFRWTGSWLTIFTTADPRGSETIPVAEHIELIDLLNRYRMAGYESYAPAPRYVGLDFYIQVCALPDAFRADVEAAILKALSSSKFADGTTGFFDTDRFTFGTPLERSDLEAAIQAAVGVGGVTSIEYRRRGVIPLPVEMGDTVTVPPDQIIRVDNDPSRPERGSLHVEVNGGK